MRPHGEECDEHCSWRQTYDSMQALGYDTPAPARDDSILQKCAAQTRLMRAIHAAENAGQIRLCTRTYQTVPRKR